MTFDPAKTPIPLRLFEDKTFCKLTLSEEGKVTTPHA